MLGKIGDASLHLAEGFAGVIDKARLFHKIIDAQRAREPRRAAGGQRVVRAGKVVAQCFGDVPAEEDAACIFDFIQHAEGVVHADFQMFGCDDVAGFDGLALMKGIRLPII